MSSFALNSIKLIGRQGNNQIVTAFLSPTQKINMPIMQHVKCSIRNYTFHLFHTSILSNITEKSVCLYTSIPLNNVELVNNYVTVLRKTYHASFCQTILEVAYNRYHTIFQDKTVHHPEHLPLSLRIKLLGFNVQRRTMRFALSVYTLHNKQPR